MNFKIKTGLGEAQNSKNTREYFIKEEKGKFQKMTDSGAVELTLISLKHPETAFGGELKYAAQVNLKLSGKHIFKGTIALEGSVYEIFCPLDPKKVLEQSN